MLRESPGRLALFLDSTFLSGPMEHDVCEVCEVRSCLYMMIDILIAYLITE